MNRNVGYVLAEAFMTLEQEPLNHREIEELGRLLRNPANRSAHDLLAFSGVRTAAGLMARLVIAEPHERNVLLTAIRRALENGDSSSQV
jgi:hypothetical protein